MARLRAGARQQGLQLLGSPIDGNFGEGVRIRIDRLLRGFHGQVIGGNYHRHRHG
jgi:hypothetical protein